MSQKEGLPTLVIAGAQKCGTTMIAAALGEHPAVQMAPGEIFQFADPSYATSSLDDLRNKFTSNPDVFRGFKCASYLAMTEVPERLVADLDAPDVVFTFREPVSRAISAWYWNVRVGYLPLESPNIGLARILNSIEEGELADGHGRNVLEWGLYGKHLQRWLEIFPSSKVHVIFDFELRSDPEHRVSALYHELGLDASFRPTTLHKRHNSGIYSHARLKLLRRRLRWLWKPDDDGNWSPSRPTQVLPALGNAAVVAADRYVLSHLTRSQPEPLDPELGQQLHEFYRDDISLLESLCHVDLVRWTSRGQPTK